MLALLVACTPPEEHADERTAEALPLIDAALARDAAPPELHVVAAQVHTSLGHDDEAVAALRRYANAPIHPQG